MPNTIEIPPSERICQFCQCCYIQMPTRGYSERTPGSDFDMDCLKNHWQFGDHISEAAFAKIIITARTCSDFQVNEQIVRECFNPETKIKKRSGGR